MSFCTKCGAELEEGGVFCPKCGSEVKERSTSTSQVKTSRQEVERKDDTTKIFHPTRITYLRYYFIGGVLIVSGLALGGLALGGLISGLAPFMFLISLIGGLIILLAESKRKAHRYMITPVDVRDECNLLSKKVSSIRYEKIQDIHSTANLRERLLGVGTVHVNSAGSSSIEIVFKGVHNPDGIREEIENRLNQ